MADSYANRMIRAAKLDRHLFEEVETDNTATTQAVGVVVLSAVAAGIGTRGGGGRRDINRKRVCAHQLVHLGLPDLLDWHENSP